VTTAASLAATYFILSLRILASNGAACPTC
jgi:hypothetical protein